MYMLPNKPLFFCLFVFKSSKSKTLLPAFFLELPTAVLYPFDAVLSQMESYEYF